MSLYGRAERAFRRSCGSGLKHLDKRDRSLEHAARHGHELPRILQIRNQQIRKLYGESPITSAT